MKKGEKKTVTLSPEDAYGPEFIKKTMPIAEYKEVITQKVPKNVLTGIVEQSLPKAQAEQILGGSTVGTEKKLGVATVKITKVDGDNITVAVNDPNAPFYGKEIKAGVTTTAQDGSVVTVKTVTGDDVEVDIKPEQTVVSKTATEITVKTKNPQNLAGKALTFEIELLSITPAAATPAPTPAPTV
jgi:FKBP-type peptidyl-prolyl cis-trans isomerase 2